MKNNRKFTKKSIKAIKSAASELSRQSQMVINREKRNVAVDIKMTREKIANAPTE